MLVRLVIVMAISLCTVSCRLYISPFSPTRDEGIYNPACNGGVMLKPLPKLWYGMKREEVHTIIGTPVRSFESKSDNSGKKILVEEYRNPTKDLEENDIIRDFWGNKEKFLHEFCYSYYYTYDLETDTLVGVSIMGGRYASWNRYRESTEWYCNQCSKSEMYVY